MKFSEYLYLIRSDLFRIHGSVSLFLFLREYYLGDAFIYNFWWRTCAYLHQFPILRYNLYLLAFMILRHYMHSLTIIVYPGTKIGSGFLISHFGGVGINPNCLIGKNFNISQGVVLGQGNRGRNKGYPVIGDNVYIGPGAKIIGAVRVGNDVAIGANCVVTHDVPDHAVVVGVPGRVISMDGAEGYVEHTDYGEYPGE
jgi:serine O-acetyltransferase